MEKVFLVEQGEEILVLTAILPELAGVVEVLELRLILVMAVAAVAADLVVLVE